MADSNLSASENQCNACKKAENKDQPLKICSRCKSAFYCSRNCQKKDRKVHKKSCTANAQARAVTDNSSRPQRGAAQDRNTTGRTNALEVNIEKPFHKLHAKTWLHGRREKDVYKLLIDTYRLRMEDNYNLTGDIDADSIYGDATDGGKAGFSRLLRTVECKRGLLPEWWSSDKKNECISIGSIPGQWSQIACAVEKHDIVEHYGNQFMPMQLRMFGEQVYGIGPGGQGGASMMQMQMELEEGHGGVYVSNMDISSMFRR